MTITQTLFWISVVISLRTQNCVLAMPEPTSSGLSLAILRARDECFRSESVSVTQRLYLDRQQYKDVPQVRRYVFCFWTRLELWHDGTGFNPMRIVETFGGPTQLNQEQTIPIINGCNTHARHMSRTAMDWCYNAFICVLRTKVGDWYRKRMLDVINANV